jgi:acetate---CoA ligase (ADP-forming)
MSHEPPTRPPTAATLRRLFYPDSIALVGASERSPWSHMLHANLSRLGYGGRVYAVNKGGVAAHGYPGYRCCSDVGEPIDVAYLFVPADAVLDAFADALAAGIKAMVILTSGFAEVGEAGARLQARLVEMAREAQAVFLGPNCLGFSNLAIRAPLTPAPNFLPVLPPRIGLVSQSGATNAQIADMAHDMNVGLSLYVATGNEAMLDIAACVEFLVEDPHTSVVMLFAESIRDTRTFAAAARRALELRKAIVVLKVGTSQLTARVAAAHTGSLVGDDAVFDAACRRLGVIRVHTLEDLLVTSSLLAYCGPLTPQSVGVVSISGGACTLLADRAEAHGVSLPDFSETTRERLRQLVPSVAEPLNPFDITGLAMRDASLFEKALRAVGQDPAIGFVLAVYEMPWNEKWDQVPQLEAIGQALADLKGRAATVNHLFRPITGKSREVMAQTGIPAAFGGIEAVMSALGRISAWSRKIDAAQGPPSPAVIAPSAARPKGEVETLAYLAQRGIPVVPSTLARSPEQAVSLAEAIPGECVLKVASVDIAHKTEVGGVRLGVKGEARVRAAYQAILSSVRHHAPEARVDGLLVSPMRQGGIELLVGTLCDPQWGPALALGLGGVWTEILDDTQLTLLPASAAEIRSLLLCLRGAQLLTGYRGSEPVDLERLAAVIARIGEAALALGPDLLSLEVNPLQVRGTQIEALDALTVWKPQ